MIYDYLNATIDELEIWHESLIGVMVCVKMTVLLS